MDMTELLGGLLKNKGKGGGSGIEQLLKGILGGGAPKPAAAPARKPNRHFGEVARDAYTRYENRGAAQAQPSELDDAGARLLVRAMVNAAKADGQLDQDEQKAIMSQLGDVTEAELNFLRSEFKAPLQVRDFAWEVPIGLEEQVYGFSVMTMNLDQNKEATYLRELAHGLRLSPEICNGIHDQCNAPKIF